MLQYIRRSEVIPRINSTVNNSNLDNNPILTYCNWNYTKQHHLTAKKLKSLIKKFNVAKLPYYVRIFNEAPIPTIQYFIDNNELNDTDLKTIWEKVSSIDGIRLRSDFWQQYNSLRVA